MNLYIIITNECNLRCEHCYKSDFETSRFSFDCVKSYLDNHLQPINITLYGGEPLLDKYSASVYELLTTVIKPRNIPCSITTNLCYDKLSDTQLKILGCVDNISTSWTRNRFNKSEFETWLKNVKQIKSCGISAPITLLVTLTSDVVDLPPTQVYELCSMDCFDRVIFEPYIGSVTDLCRPKNFQVDDWLTNFFRLLTPQEYKRYSPFNDIINNILNNARSGIFGRRCVNNTITLNTDGTIGDCPSSLSKSSNKKLNLYKISDNCFICGKYKICGGTCPLLEFDSSGCPGYPTLIKCIEGNL